MNHGLKVLASGASSVKKVYLQVFGNKSFPVILKPKTDAAPPLDPPTRERPTYPPLHPLSGR